MRGGFSSEPVGRRTRCLKRFIFKRPKVAQPGRGSAANSGLPCLAKIVRILTIQIYSSNPENLVTTFAPRISSGRAVLLKLDGYVFDGRERAENVNFLVRRVDVNLQSRSLSAYPHVFVMIVHFNEFSIWILFQFFDDGAKDRHGLARLLGAVPQMLGWHEMQDHGDGGGGN